MYSCTFLLLKHKILCLLTYVNRCDVLCFFVCVTKKQLYICHVIKNEYYEQARTNPVKKSSITNICICHVSSYFIIYSIIN